MRHSARNAFIFALNDHLPSPHTPPPASSSDTTFVSPPSAKLAEHTPSPSSSSSSSTSTEHANGTAISSSSTIPGSSHSRRRSRGSRGLLGDMFSPRSSNYERLEGGMGPSKNGSGRRFAWKKFAIGAVVIIGLVYFFGPRKETFDEYIPSIISDPTHVDYEAPEPTVTRVPIRPPHEDDMVPPARPTDPASDGDLTKTHLHS
ncbi:hypothetical protein NUW54_g9722 [Trametes sanguinea]|uniref:Uncharacterized protein n=1 Tax=Trametes sanguinea TaxID=158606 RepID=A0ACC1P438_9APHY|nr:hypothetical protein NUW54_g9722 [Trametes sanguinea]